MSLTSTRSTDAALETSGPQGRGGLDNRARLLCGLTALLALVPFALCSFSGASGTAITADLVESSGPLQVGAFAAVLVAAGLVVAAVGVGHGVGGVLGGVLRASGVGVAAFYAAYYAAFGAGAVVADQMLDRPGPGIGEATALLVNVTEIARYAPTLALLVAGSLAGALLPRALRIVAALLAVLMLVPMTTWAVALVAPLWLALAAVLRR